MTPIRNNCATDRPDSLVERFDALAVVDTAGTNWSPGSVLLERREGRVRVLAVGLPAHVDRHPASPAARRVSLPRSVLIPGLVNAHTHLDLTHLGPRPFRPEGGFVGWVDGVRTGRRLDEEQIVESVRRGIALSLLGGTVAVGDIAGAPRGGASLAPFRELSAAGMFGVSYLEFFGIGIQRRTLRQRLLTLINESAPNGRDGRDRMRLGLQPHAPNTVALPIYQWAARFSEALALPVSTHLAETIEEREFIGRGTGPQREMLERLGVWDDAMLDHIGRGRHPVGHLAKVLNKRPFVAAHVNDADDAAIATLVRTGTSVAYCPRASAYFGAERHFGPHRYQEMLAAGVNVALGTDSIVNLPDAAANEGMSIVDEMRFLHRRDGVGGWSLLKMATLNGARALGLDLGLFMIKQEHELAGLVAVEAGDGPGDPLDRALASSARPVLLFPKN